MADWARDPVPPGHGESAPSSAGDRQRCWCGRPLVTERRMVGGRGDVEQKRIVCPEHGYAKYTVQVVYRDGNPAVVYRSTELSWALTEAAFIRATHASQGMGPSRVFVGVTDEDDPELGWLSDEDE